MQKSNSILFDVVMILIGAAILAYLAILLAPSLLTENGIFGLADGMNEAFAHPFKLVWCDITPKVIGVFWLIYLLSMTMYYTDRKDYHRKGEEHGSAEWGNATKIDKKYKDKNTSENKLLTQNFYLGLDGHKHRRNLNTLICGGSGAGKTRFYAKPNIMQANTSFVILDPKGEIIRDTGSLLEEKGYEIKVLDLINLDRSNAYNPFVYIRNDNDIQRLVTNLFKSTTPKDSKGSQDPFWDTAAQMLLMALMFLLHYECDPEDQNFATVMYLLRLGAITDEDDNDTPLDLMFRDLEEREKELGNPEHIAVKYYKNYHSGSGKTLQSIQITLAARLEKFNLEDLTKMTMTDELDLSSMGEKKTALFAIIPDNDTSFNFIVSILYTQLFQQLFATADFVHGGSLPVPVHFVMDEFANVSLPDDFDKILAVMRSRNVFVSIIIQNLAQLKTLFEKQWESIVGNCDEFLYLGGNEKETHKYISELLGKETIDTTTNGRTHGEKGSYSTNYQNAGRELMTPDEVRMLDNQYAILFVRGERPIMDLKYDILKHPNVGLTTDGGGRPYIHGLVKDRVASVQLSSRHYDGENAYDVEIGENNYELVGQDDFIEENKDEIDAYYASRRGNK